MIHEFIPGYIPTRTENRYSKRYSHVHISSIHNSEKVEAARVKIKVKKHGTRWPLRSLSAPQSLN